MVIIGDTHFDSRVGTTTTKDILFDKMDKIIEYINYNDKVVFLGDYFNPSEPANIYREYLSSILNKINVPKILIVGNHDRDKRGSYSIAPIQEFLKKDDIIVNDFYEEGDFCYIAYSLNFQHIIDIINNTKCKYVVGHFSFDYEKNSKIMKGEIEYDSVWDNKQFILGHIHKHQAKKNVMYVGALAPTKLDELEYDYNIVRIENDKIQLKPIKYDLKVKVVKSLKDLDGVDGNTKIIIEGNNVEETNKIIEALKDKKVLDYKSVSKKHDIDISKLKIDEMIKEYLEQNGRIDLFNDVMKFVPKNVSGIE